MALFYNSVPKPILSHAVLTSPLGRANSVALREGTPEPSLTTLKRKEKREKALKSLVTKSLREFPSQGNLD